MKYSFLLLSLVYALITFGQDFEVAPVLIRFNAEPGSIQSTKLSIKNYANTKQKYEVSLSDYSIDELGNKKSLAAGQSENSLANWLTLNPSFVELNPNESKEIDIMITVPKGHSETRWGMAHVKVAKEKTALDVDKEMATGVVLIPRIVVLIKQSPKSNHNYSAKIQDLKEIDKDGEYRTFEALIVNNGDKVIDAKVSLSVANIMTAKEENFPKKKFTVYPKQSRSIQISLPKVLEKGEYAIAIIMDYGHRKSLEGAQLIIKEE